jgi:hypothetical protein
MILEVFVVSNLRHRRAALGTLFCYKPVFPWPLEAKNVGDLSIVTVELFLNQVIIGRELSSSMDPPWLVTFILLGGHRPFFRAARVEEKLSDEKGAEFFSFVLIVRKLPLTNIT